MANPTSPAKLEELATALSRHEGELREVLERMRQDIRQLDDFWQGNTADTFRHHVDRDHRQRHLEQAADRLRAAARLARAAAAQNEE